MKNVIKYLRKKEWSMGHGQCPECCGVSHEWLGDINYLTSKNLGHLKTCSLAKALEDLDEYVLYRGESKDTSVHETYWTKTGILSTRVVKIN